MYSAVSVKLKMLRKQLAVGAVTAGVIGLAAAGAPGWAQTIDSGSVDVSLNAVTTCTVTTQDIDFGDYAGTEVTVPPSGTGTSYELAALECSVGFVNAVFCLNEGQYFNGTTRRMRNTAAPTQTHSDYNVDYEVYFGSSGFAINMGESPHPSNSTGMSCDGGGTVHPGLESYFTHPSGYSTEWRVLTQAKTLGGGAMPGIYTDTLTATFIFQ